AASLTNLINHRITTQTFPSHHITRPISAFTPQKSFDSPLVSLRTSWPTTRIT
ncbi:hypothetical protein COCCADRAFT_82099, partial [Bipolaris zeicola 26-R-13]